MKILSSFELQTKGCLPFQYHIRHILHEVEHDSLGYFNIQFEEIRNSISTRLQKSISTICVIKQATNETWSKNHLFWNSKPI